MGLHSEEDMTLTSKTTRHLIAILTATLAGLTAHPAGTATTAPSHEHSRQEHTQIHTRRSWNLLRNNLINIVRDTGFDIWAELIVQVDTQRWTNLQHSASPLDLNQNTIIRTYTTTFYKETKNRIVRNWSNCADLFSPGYESGGSYSVICQKTVTSLSWG